NTAQYNSSVSNIPKRTGTKLFFWPESTVEFISHPLRYLMTGVKFNNILVPHDGNSGGRINIVILVRNRKNVAFVIVLNLNHALLKNIFFENLQRIRYAVRILQLIQEDSDITSRVLFERAFTKRLCLQINNGAFLHVPIENQVKSALIQTWLARHSCNNFLIVIRKKLKKRIRP